MANNSLITYLSDHLAASTAAVELLGNLKDAAEPKRASEIQALIAEIELDRDALRDILHRAGGEESSMKKAGAWAAEKLALGKLAVEDLHEGSLGEMEALEVLSLGIEGKAGLWRALSVVGPEAVEPMDLQTLLWRAARQREIVETWRIAAARVALC